jgi:two-component system cell cycle response regulator DivK
MSKKILVVEDQEDNRRILRDLLTSVGHDMLEVEDGEAAIAAAKQYRPDLILMDIQLPIMDGRGRGASRPTGPARDPIIVVALCALATRTRRACPDATPMSPSPTARASFWRRSTRI